MNSINKLGLVVAATVAILVVAVFGAWQGIRALSEPDTAQRAAASPTPRATQDPRVASARQDTDSDGAPDVVEDAFGSDPSNPDTDGDGTNDGQEIAEGRNPLQAGPDDISAPETGSSVLDTSTYTGKYLATLPDGAGRDQVLDREQLEAFVDKHRSKELPQAKASELTIVDDSGKEATKAYLDAVSSSHNENIEPVTASDIEAAHQLSYTGQEPEALTNIISTLEANIAELEQVEVPQEHVDLHIQLLSASRGLLQNTKLLQQMPDDFVGGLIGAKNIEVLGTQFQDIGDRVAELEQQYGLE